MGHSASLLDWGARMSVRQLSSWRRPLIYCACGLVIVATCGAYYDQRWDSPAAFREFIDSNCVEQYVDFRWYYYRQAQRILEAEQPIRQYFYSPTFALLLVPIGQLPPAEAMTVWTWVQAASLIALIVGSLLLLRGYPLWTHALVLLLTLTSYPVLHNLSWGQANTTFMALIVLSLALYERGRQHLAAFALSLVVASRYYPAIYGAAFLTRGRRKAFVLLAVYSLALLVDLPLIFMGVEQAWSFYSESAVQISRATSGWIATRPGSGYLPTVAARLARHWGLESLSSQAAWTVLASLLAACNIALVGWSVYKRTTQRTLWAFCFIALSTPLLVPTSWIHYFVYLPLVQTFTAAELANARASRRLKAVGFVVVWAPATWLSSLSFYDLVGGAQVYAERGFVLISNLIMLALTYSLFAARSRLGHDDRQAAGQPAVDCQRLAVDV